MRNSSTPRRSPAEPVKGTTTGNGSPSNPPRPADIHRLACDLAAEWCCRHEEYLLNAFEVMP
jgi:hypothetical protein